MSRYKDEGTYLGHFLHEIFVICPQCGQRAVVGGNYVGAPLREQAPGIGNRSLSTRLPQWMLDAKNRQQVLKALEKLEKRI